MKQNEERRRAAEALLEKLEAVFQAYVRIEDVIQEEIRRIPWGQIPDKESARAYHYLEYVVSNVARQSMLTMVCAWLEEAMDIIGDGSIPGYMAEVHRKNGSWFKKRLKVFEGYGVTFDGIDDECSFMVRAIKVRNCLVHAGGRVERHRTPEDIEDAVKWLQAKAKLGNFSYVSVRNGLLYLGDNIVAGTICSSEEILRHLFRGVAGLK